MNERGLAPLRLERALPIRDVRKLVWRHLTPEDREVVRCAHNSKRRPKLHADFVEECAKRGYMSLIEWAAANSRLRNEEEDVCGVAAEYGQLETLQWLRARGFPWDYRTAHRAIRHGHLSVVQWCHANGADMCVLPCQLAASWGQLEVLRWLREAGYAWNEDTCMAAAFYGRLDALQWLRAHGCPWDAKTYVVAETRGHPHVARWARNNGCPLPQ